MLEKILQALRDEGYDANVIKGTIYVSVEEFDLYRIYHDETSIRVHSVDTGRDVMFKNYNEFLYFLES
ncbi:hypothetical protein PQB73_gp259 [Cronobacter phage LPCS28]|uniref:Uncharacterized protein n=1 Tax=Cronobacter phage LPCS28 TaxID=2924885 RepID=A0AAE9K637_9CAUD|nr:hypothetical protein PQB73_gp259 [Cronobacter phage LPCS28]UNY46954.1 hypothetical protein EHEKIMEA_00066 [Cronobacter phage LPCS28]